MEKVTKLIDVSVCIGCKACQVACSEWNDLRDEVGEAMFSRGATWDVRLALAVLEATNSAGGEFWDLYRRLLPLPVALSTPACLPP